MEAYVAGRHARSLLRRARYSAWPRLHACMDVAARTPEGERPQWWRPAVTMLRPYVDMDAKSPLELYVAGQGSRVRAELASGSACPPHLPRGAFVFAELPGDVGSVRIESPALSFARFAQEVVEEESAGGIDAVQTRALLLDYGYELCGSYARDALAPLESECHYFLNPTTTSRDLSAWCGSLYRYRHKRRAEACAREVLEGSASPMETLHAIVLSSGPEKGGMALGRPLLNEQLRVGPAERWVLHRHSMRPDLFFPELNLAIEHLGGKHGSGAAYEEDAAREQVYAALDIALFTTTRRDMETPQNYDLFLRRLIHRLGKERGRSLERRLLERLNDPLVTRARWEMVDILTGKG